MVKGELVRSEERNGICVVLGRAPDKGGETKETDLTDGGIGVSNEKSNKSKSLGYGERVSPIETDVE